MRLTSDRKTQTGSQELEKMFYENGNKKIDTKKPLIIGRELGSEGIGRKVKGIKRYTLIT